MSNKRIEAVVFDLDGVITDTAQFHYLAWKSLGEELGIEIDEAFNETLKGVNRLDSLELILKKGNRENDFELSEREALAAKKNNHYCELLKELTPDFILPGIKELFTQLKKENIKIGLASASKNAQIVLRALKMDNEFDYCVDAAKITNSKPDPEIFLNACEGLGVHPSKAIGIEDATVGVESIQSSGMFAIGVLNSLTKADYVVGDTSELDWGKIKTAFEQCHMKIVIASDSFKESLTSIGVADAIEKGWRTVFPKVNIIKVPMADGGEGTVQSLVDATNGRIVHKIVTGPLLEPVEAYFGILGDGKTAVIEMATASGLHHVPIEKRNPYITTTIGFGELILAALDEGVTHFILGLGGSATNDGGAGMAQALGAKLLDKEGNELPAGGRVLASLCKIDISEMDKRLIGTNFEVACDVDNPLTGKRGASAVFAPQKGASAEMAAELDKALSNYAQVIGKYLKVNVEYIPGVGAAGGLGAGIVAFLQGSLKRGIDIVIEATNLESQVRDADLVITGEGRIDSQTIYGKAPCGVAKLAKKYDVPVIGIAGSATEDSYVVHEHGIDVVFPIVPGAVSLDIALREGEKNLVRTSRNIAKLISLRI